ncbi:helix-turn-helix domain-containing protein [uncultured Acetobacteroides sp.]|uniref:helix-turn-helix domain-containing protein n=1 Tax=uncultured Acetobacteroides sp. TaxID=1760811 RepID=UPI0029F4C2D7|nr:helix-turn-helix domain-containing protein [uncultured Acetobacteroides sp.]
MISLNLEKLVKLRGYSNVLEFTRAIGMHPSRYRVLMNNPKTISYKLLDRLCWELRCTPNELLEWEPDAHQAKDENHPLRQLIATRELRKLQQAV